MTSSILSGFWVSPLRERLGEDRPQELLLVPLPVEVAAGQRLALAQVVERLAWR